MYKLIYLFRRPGTLYFSIERLFRKISAQLAENYFSEFQVENKKLPFASKPFSILANISFMRKNQGDVNHITGDAHYAILGCGNKRLNILTIHDCVLLHQYPAGGIKHKVLKKFWYDLPIKKADAVTVISENTKNEILGFVHCDPEKIRVIPNFVDPVFKPSTSAFNTHCPRLLFIGTTINKNLDRFIAAIQGLEVELEIVGNLTDEQKKALLDAGISYRQSSGLSENELMEKYRDCDIVVFPSTYEGFGLPVLEGQASGRVVLTSDCSPMREVAGGGACLVDPLNIASMHNGLVRIINDPAYRDELIKKGFDNIRHYQLDTITDQYVSLYRELMLKKSIPG